MKVNKLASDIAEAEIRILKARKAPSSSTPEIKILETNSREDAENIFDSMF